MMIQTCVGIQAFLKAYRAHVMNLAGFLRASLYTVELGMSAQTLALPKDVTDGMLRYYCTLESLF